MNKCLKIISATHCLLVIYTLHPGLAQAEAKQPIYCQNNGFRLLADEITKAKMLGLPATLIASAERDYKRARRWRMRARTAECEGLLRNAFDDLRQTEKDKTASSKTSTKCNITNLISLAAAITKGRKAKLSHSLIRSVQSRYLISKKLLSQNKLKQCSAQIATGLRTLRKSHAAQAKRAKNLARGVECNDIGFASLNAEMRIARVSDLAPSAINTAKNHYRKARRLRRKQNTNSCAGHLNSGLLAIQKARE